MCSDRVPLASVIHFFFFFFFNDTATTEIYTLSLHDALPISLVLSRDPPTSQPVSASPCRRKYRRDRKSTRLNSSHSQISYAVFCLKKKKTTRTVRPVSSSNSRAKPSS